MRSMTLPLLALALLLPAAARAGVVKEKEPNNTLAGAQAVDGHFTLDFSADIGNGTHVDNTSTTIPHVTVHGSGDGSFDYYSFYFPGAGSTAGFVVLDIDHSSSGFDSHLALWATNGDLLGHNDDYDYRGGAGGSVPKPHSDDSYDSLMTTYLSAPGTYVVGVGLWSASPVKGGYEEGFAGAKPRAGDFYTLQISVENVPVVPEPGTGALLGLGALGVLTAVARRRA
ncbi:MAG: DVUA0089 family protein [Burkholderiaceae bacterium]|nr:DVUA0089 family protein [Burkholderiaceae bacterium]